jgi:hypothetical protein
MKSKFMLYLSLPFRILPFDEGGEGSDDADDDDDDENNNLNSASNNAGILNQFQLKLNSINYYGCAA